MKMSDELKTGMVKWALFKTYCKCLGWLRVYCHHPDRKKVLPPFGTMCREGTCPAMLEQAKLNEGRNKRVRRNETT